MIFGYLTGKLDNACDVETAVNTTQTVGKVANFVRMGQLKMEAEQFL